VKRSSPVLLVLACACADGESDASAGARADAHRVASSVSMAVDGIRGMDVFESASAPADLSPLEGTEGDRVCPGDGSGCPRAPRVLGVPSDDGFVPVVACGDPDRVTKVELRASFGSSHVSLEADPAVHPFRWRASADAADSVRYYHLFMDVFGGHLVVRVHYVDGEVWRRTVRLKAPYLRPED